MSTVNKKNKQVASSMSEKANNSPSQSGRQIAEAFVAARLSAAPVTAYPGDAPRTLKDAYAIQDRAIDLWPDQIAGWKVGRITGRLAQELKCDRLAGPIFKRSVFRAGEKPVDMPVFAGGFAAIEAECILILGEDAPPSKLRWTHDEAKELIGDVLTGIEIASSPFAGINDLGPLVTISDFGNNNGLILGEPIQNWRALSVEDWRFQTLIDGRETGVNTAASIPGGPVESLRFLLEHTASRGLPLKKGAAISSGAVTGVHEATVGAIGAVRFAGLPQIECRLVPAQPRETPQSSSAREISA